MSEVRLPSAVRVGHSRLERERRRAAHIRLMAGGIGLANAVKLEYARVRHDDPEKTVRLSARGTGLRHALHVPTSVADIANVREILVDRVYDVLSKHTYGLNGQPIVDFGAFLGISAVNFVRSFPDSQVTAFEPANRNLPYAVANAWPYQGQIEVRHQALALSHEPVGMKVQEEGNHMTYAFGHDYPALTETEDMPGTVTPEDLLAEFGRSGIGILKLDVEGPEGKLLSSGDMDPVLAVTSLWLVESHDRYEPGCSQAIQAAAGRVGMSEIFDGNGHTMMFK